MITAAIILLALILDAWLGEPRRGHPLVAFGRLAGWLEERLNTPDASVKRLRLRGALAVTLLALICVVPAFVLTTLPTIGIAFEVLFLYLCLGGSSLVEHARRVARPLAQGQVAPARRRVSHLVSRDTEALDEHGVAGATVESVLENGHDAVFATLFWFIVLGAPGAVLHRVANTLDAMWGYRTARYLNFGMTAARLDDVLGYIPARLTALSYALVGNVRQAVSCWYRQARHWHSPNAGPVMAAGAGALGLALGGEARYHGEIRERPQLGTGRKPRGFDIERALSLLKRALALWMLVIGAVGWLLA